VKLFSYLSISAFIIGFSTGIYLPAIIPLITNYFDEKIWGKTIAIHDTAASVSIFSMPFIVLFFLKFLEWREIFYIFGGVFILCIILFYLFSNEVRVEKTHENLFVNLVKEKPLWIMSIIWMFSTGANFGIYSIIPLYLTKELGIEMGYANKVFGLSRLGGVLVAIMTGFIVDRFSLKKTLFSMMLTTGFLTIIIAHKDVRLIQIILFFQAAFASGFFPVGLVAISRIFRSEQRSMATGFIVTASVIFGGGIIPYGLGLTGDLISFRLGIFLLGILVIIASTFTFLLKSLK
jgi:NNP family nitrate/nitrite transporter-like MFS transporter